MGTHQPLYRTECQRLIVAKKGSHQPLYMTECQRLTVAKNRDTSVSVYDWMSEINSGQKWGHISLCIWLNVRDEQWPKMRIHQLLYMTECQWPEMGTHQPLYMTEWQRLAVAKNGDISASVYDRMSETNSGQKWGHISLCIGLNFRG